MTKTKKIMTASLLSILGVVAAGTAAQADTNLNGEFFIKASYLDVGKDNVGYSGIGYMNGGGGGGDVLGGVTSFTVGNSGCTLADAKIILSGLSEDATITSPGGVTTPIVSDVSFPINEVGTWTINGEYTSFGAGNISLNHNVMCLTSVNEWSNTGVQSLSGALANARNLTSVPATLPATVTDTSFMFRSAVIFNQDISSWNMSNVSNAMFMLSEAVAFNQDISSWDVSNITNMSYMLFNTSNFNQDISSWDTSSATNMTLMLAQAWSFNQDLSGWTVCQITNPANYNHFGLHTPVPESYLPRFGQPCA